MMKDDIRPYVELLYYKIP